MCVCVCVLVLCSHCRCVRCTQAAYGSVQQHLRGVLIGDGFIACSRTTVQCAGLGACVQQLACCVYPGPEA